MSSHEPVIGTDMVDMGGIAEAGKVLEFAADDELVAAN